jgi:hypothetical protein
MSLLFNNWKKILVWAPVVRRGYWEVAISNIVLGSTTVPSAIKSGAIDTGTSLLASKYNHIFLFTFSLQINFSAD